MIRGEWGTSGVESPAPVVALQQLGHNGHVPEAPRQTIRRRDDEPKLEIGEMLAIKGGVIGVVLARFVPSGDNTRNEVHYIGELLASSSPSSASGR